MSNWNGGERRKSTLPANVEIAIADRVAEVVRNEMKDLKETFHNDIKELEVSLENKLNDGFPNKDPLGHRLHHEKVILNARHKNELREKIIEKVVTGLVWAAILGVGLLVNGWLKGGLNV